MGSILFLCSWLFITPFKFIPNFVCVVLLEHHDYVLPALCLYGLLILACETQWSPTELIIKCYVNISLHKGYILSYIPRRQCEIKIL